ncbi:MAG: DUF192 domain-containing protein [Oligoflexia bacterium]|nr:DUF192 domain-containing protein [Oligoflexia bacterium]
MNQRTGILLGDQVEIAQTFSTRLIGLIGRKELKSGEGLLIKGSGNSIHTCFMKFPIDAVFFDSKGQVIHLAKGLHPWRMTIAKSLKRTDVLELPMGAIEASDTRIGDHVSVTT